MTKAQDMGASPLRDDRATDAPHEAAGASSPSGSVSTGAATLCDRLRATRPPIAPRPTIAELEAILAAPASAIEIQPNGEVRAAGDQHINPDGPEAAAEIERLRGTLARLVELTPERANAATADDLHLTVKAIAESAIAKAKGQPS